MNLLGVLAKHWTPGKVKTRLAKDLGAERAAQWHLNSYCTLCRRLGTVGARSCSVWFDPIESLDDFRAHTPPGWSLHPQPSGDLGYRLRYAFDQGFMNGAERIVVLGADSPDVPLAYVEEAFAQLNRYDVVVGPAEDGGYYLIGASQATPNNLFENIAWGESSVLQATLAAAERSKLSTIRLPFHYDIDALTDLQRFTAAACHEPELTDLQIVAKDMLSLVSDNY